MSTRGNIREAVEAWQAVGERERAFVTDTIDGVRQERLGCSGTDRMQDALVAAWLLLRAAAEPEATMKPDDEPSPEQLQRFARGIPGNETCLYCGKHISRHYGGTDYRCYPRNV
jgi:hypothetical protein